MEERNFYDMKTKQKFKSSEYGFIINKKGMLVAVAKTASGSNSYCIVRKATADDVAQHGSKE